LAFTEDSRSAEPEIDNLPSLKNLRFASQLPTQLRPARVRQTESYSSMEASARLAGHEYHGVFVLAVLAGA
jgi:hypothetical protein